MKNIILFLFALIICPFSWATPSMERLWADSVSYGQATTFHAHVTDTDDDLEWVDFYVNGPNLPGWNYVGKVAVSGSDATAEISWTPPQSGDFAVHAFAHDLTGAEDAHLSVAGFSVGFFAPSCDSITTSANPVTTASYVVFANNVQNAVRVWFPTWSDVLGQDNDLIWYEGVYDPAINGWKCTVNRSEHRNAIGGYTTNVWALGADNQMYGLGGAVVTVQEPNQSHLSVTATVTDTSIGVGQTVSFTVSASCGAGLSSLGLEQCDATGAVTSSLDSFTVNGVSATQRFSWVAPSSGTHYFKCYAWNADRTQILRTSVYAIIVAAPVLTTKTIASDSYVRYGDSCYAQMAGGQSITVDSVTGFVVAGRLAAASGQYLYYGLGRTVFVLQNSLIKFRGGYVQDCYMDYEYGPISLYYGPGRVTGFYPKAHMKFENGYVLDGYLLNQYGEPVVLYYGDGRTAQFAPKCHIKFQNGFVSDGYLYNSGDDQYLPYGSVNKTYFAKYTHITFAGGYVATGSPVSRGSNSDYYKYNSSGATVMINVAPNVSVFHSFPGKGKILEIMSNIDKAVMKLRAEQRTWAALAADTGTGVVIPGSWLTIDTKEAFDILTTDSVAAATKGVTIAYAKISGIENGFTEYGMDRAAGYTIYFDYPAVAFSPGSDGKGYLTMAQLAENVNLITTTGSMYVTSGTVCVFKNGYYVP